MLMTKRAYSRNLGQRSIMARKDMFFYEKGHLFDKRVSNPPFLTFESFA